MKKILRFEAKQQNLKRYFTGMPCKHGHISERLTSDGKCIECRKIYLKANAEEISLSQKSYRQKNIEKVLLIESNYRENNQEKIKIKSQKFRDENKDKIALKDKKYREKNKEKISTYQKQYRQDKRKEIALTKKIYREINKETVALREKTWYQSNKNIASISRKKRRNTPKGKLETFIRHSLQRMLKSIKENKNIDSLRTLEYTPLELKEHIESQFKDDMTWENHGKIWHIDHKISINYFINNLDIKNISQEELHQIINALENLKPLYIFENLSKGSKIE